MARPTKYDPSMCEKVRGPLVLGNTRKVAATLIGISQATFERWQKRYGDFDAAVKLAEAEAEQRHVATIKQASLNGVWTASAWWLERRRSEDWGRKDKLEIISTVREMARAAGADEDAAVSEAEAFLKEIRSGAGR